MGIDPQIYLSKVMHKRLIPKVNRFTYGVYYLAFPLSKINALSDGWRFGVNTPGILSFYEKDHGARDGSNLEEWARQMLKQKNITKADGDIVLITLPRVLGYVFNPVSFWLCLDKKNQIRAVICEVNNTFGETHSYICAHQNGSIIQHNEWFEADKLFHVSPFLHRDGRYLFRFAYETNSFGVWIDYFNESGEKQLLTSLSGTLQPYNKKSRSRAFWQHPLITLKTISLIHWQAIKLLTKGIKYITKPTQREEKLSITKM